MLDRFARGGAAALVLPPFTQRECEVLVALALGLSNLETADRLIVSHSTVKTQVSHLLTKLEARDRARLAMLVHRAGLGG